MGDQTKIIGVYIDGDPTYHIIGVGAGDYSTACGLDGNDSVVGQSGTFTAGRGQKIDCQQCFRLWKEITALHLRQGNFADKLIEGKPK